MMASGFAESLHELLVGDNRELVDIKFMPGQGRSLTAGRMLEEARGVATQLLDESVPDSPPVTGLKKKPF